MWTCPSRIAAPSFSDPAGAQLAPIAISRRPQLFRAALKVDPPLMEHHETRSLGLLLAGGSDLQSSVRGYCLVRCHVERVSNLMGYSGRCLFPARAMFSNMDPLAGSQWSTPRTVAGFAQSAPNDVLMAFGEEELRRATLFLSPASAGRSSALISRGRCSSPPPRALGRIASLTTCT
jgi:hypothetical protein